MLDFWITLVSNSVTLSRISFLSDDRNVTSHGCSLTEHHVSPLMRVTFWGSGGRISYPRLARRSLPRMVYMILLTITCQITGMCHHI